VAEIGTCAPTKNRLFTCKQINISSFITQNGPNKDPQIACTSFYSSFRPGRVYRTSQNATAIGSLCRKSFGSKNRHSHLSRACTRSYRRTTLNWKSNNKPEPQPLDAKGWFLRGAAAGVGIAVSVVVVGALKNWLSKADDGEYEAEEYAVEDKEALKMLA
jgi:hypothetical protein